MAIDENAFYAYIGKRVRERRRAVNQTQQRPADRIEAERSVPS